MMNNVSVPSKDGQAPARRFGGCVAILVTLVGCLCISGLWLLLAGDSAEILKTSWHLRSNGVNTIGTIVRLEEHPGTKPYSNPTYYFFVDFDVDGKTYTVKSNKFYPAKNTSRIGESMLVIYDPQDPNIAQLDTLDERWLDPIFSILPF